MSLKSRHISGVHNRSCPLSRLHNRESAFSSLIGFCPGPPTPLTRQQGPSHPILSRTLSCGISCTPTQDAQEKADQGLPVRWPEHLDLARVGVRHDVLGLRARQLSRRGRGGRGVRGRVLEDQAGELGREARWRGRAGVRAGRLVRGRTRFLPLHSFGEGRGNISAGVNVHTSHIPCRYVSPCLF